MDALRLPVQFDAPRLLRDLDYVESGVTWHNHPDYSVAKSGDWTAVALIASTPDPNDPNSLRYRGGKGEPTALLKACPYLQEVIGTFKTEVHRARLMNLRPGTDITPHRDYGTQRYSLERGFIRVHIPLRTHEKVYFFINHKVIPMKAGEAWYTNVCQLHAVRNDSTVQRVHLVLDMKVNDWVRGLFPPQSMMNRAYGVLLRRFEPQTIAARVWVRTRYGEVRTWLGDIGLRRVKQWMTG